MTKTYYDFLNEILGDYTYSQLSNIKSFYKFLFYSYRNDIFQEIWLVKLQEYLIAKGEKNKK